MAGWDPPLVFHRVVSVCQSFRPVAQFFFPSKILFFSLIFKYGKGVCHIDMLKMFPVDTDHIYIYIWVCGLTSIVQA